MHARLALNLSPSIYTCMNILHFLALNGGGQRKISIFPFFFSLFKSLYLLFSGALLLIYGPRLAVCKGSLAKASIGWAIRTVSVGIGISQNRDSNESKY